MVVGDRSQKHLAHNEIVVPHRGGFLSSGGADLDPEERREVATIVRGLSETLAEVSDGKAASQVLGVLAHLLDPP